METLENLRKKDYNELLKTLNGKRKEILDLLMMVKSGNTDTKKKRELKKEIAQINTILREKEILNV